MEIISNIKSEIGSSGNKMNAQEFAMGMKYI